MELPFTKQAFFAVFAAYNEAVWPAQLLLVLLALSSIALLARPRSWTGSVISAGLALLWVWMATAYHIAFFTRINPLAWGFAALSLAGSLAFVWHGLVRSRLRFAWPGGLSGIAGTVLIVFALLVYPAWSVMSGHRYPGLPTFGLPCPTTIFTIGMLAFLVPPRPPGVFVAPLVWSAIGVQAAFRLDMPADSGLILAGLAGLALVLSGRRRGLA